MRKNLVLLLALFIVAPSAFADSKLGQNSKINNNIGKTECSKKMKWLEAQGELAKAKKENSNQISVK